MGQQGGQQKTSAQQGGPELEAPRQPAQLVLGSLQAQETPGQQPLTAVEELGAHGSPGASPSWAAR